MFADFIQGLKELTFPDNCILCRTFLNSRHKRQLCTGCLESIKRNVPPFCVACSRHLQEFSINGICSSCQGQQRHYDRAWGTCFYTDTMRKLLHAYKYSGKTRLRKTFVPLMTNFIDTYSIPIEDFDIILPIPLHPVRMRERGFNQSALLSEGIALHYQLNHHTKILTRIRATDSQTVLDTKQRWTNLASAFRMNPSESVVEKSILLVDDLLTTGATADAAAEALKSAGAAYVGVLTLAITE